MRIIRVKIYRFHELSKEAQQNAVNNWLETEDFDYLISDATASFEKFAEIFGIKWRQIDYLEPYRNEYRVNIPDGAEELTGQRLATYIWNNYRTDLYKGKYYGKLVNTHKDGSPIEKSKKHPAGLRHVIRHSRIFIEWDNCPFTGLCYDYPLIQPFIDFMNKPNDRETLESLIDTAINALCWDIQNEIEACSTIEYYSDHADSNNYEFTKDGKRI